MKVHDTEEEFALDFFYTFSSIFSYSKPSRVISFIFTMRPSSDSLGICLDWRVYCAKWPIKAYGICNPIKFHREHSESNQIVWQLEWDGEFHVCIIEPHWLIYNWLRVCLCFLMFWFAWNCAGAVQYKPVNYSFN